MADLDIYQRYGGKKFLFTATGLLMGFVLALRGSLSGDFTAILIALAGFYNTANVAEKASAAKYAQTARAGVPDGG